MWQAYNEAYQNKEAVELASLPIEKTHSRILMICGEYDEAWPSRISVEYMEARLKDHPYDHKVIIYPKGSHLIGMMPSKEKNKLLYHCLPLVKIMDKSFGLDIHRSMEYFQKSENEIIHFLNLL